MLTASISSIPVQAIITLRDEEDPAKSVYPSGGWIARFRSLGSNGTANRLKARWRGSDLFVESKGFIFWRSGELPKH
jgi:hypothetical protein